MTLTLGDVALITSTVNYYIRAFDVTTGTLLWQDRLHTEGSTDANDPQSVRGVNIRDRGGGHGSFGTKLGDYVRAYVLPRNK